MVIVSAEFGGKQSHETGAWSQVSVITLVLLLQAHLELSLCRSWFVKADICSNRPNAEWTYQQ